MSTVSSAVRVYELGVHLVLVLVCVSRVALVLLTWSMIPQQLAWSAWSSNTHNKMLATRARVR